MPIVAILGAALAIGVAAPAIGALAGAATIGAGLASIGVAGALEITAAVGATLGAVGAVTRDKGLQTAGMIIGGIGAVGSIASAAGLFDNVGSLFGSAAATGTDVASDVAFAQSGAAADVANNVVTDGIPSAIDITPSVMRGSGDIISALQPAPVTVSAAGNVNIANPAQQTLTDSGANAAQQATQTPADTLINGTANLKPTTPVSTPAATGTTATAAAATPATAASKGPLDGILDFVNKNPMASYGLIQTAGSFISGATNPITPAQISQLNSQAALNRANAAVTNQVALNMASGMPVARSKPVNAAAVTGAPIQGMINSSAVTGAVQ